MTQGIYLFLKDQWIMRRIDKEYLDKMVEKGRITQEEEDDIVTTPQVGDTLPQ